MAESDEIPLPFDAIEVSDGTATSTMTLEALLAMPLPDRVRLLAEGRIQFLRGGQRIDPQVALRAVSSRRRRSSVTFTTMKIERPKNE